MLILQVAIITHTHTEARSPHNQNVFGFFPLYLLFLGETSCDKNTGTTDSLDSPLSCLAEELGLDNNGLLGQVTFAEDLVVTLKHKTHRVFLLRTW